MTNAHASKCHNSQRIKSQLVRLQEVTTRMLDSRNYSFKIQQGINDYKRLVTQFQLERLVDYNN